MIFSDTEKASIGYDHKTDHTYLVFKRSIGEEDMVEAHKTLLDMITEHHVCSGKHMSDARALNTLTAHSRQWINKVVVPFIQERSAKQRAKIALVLSEPIMAELNLSNCEQRYSHEADTMIFDNDELAREWLATQ